jgi:hypothetical protein
MADDGPVSELFDGLIQAAVAFGSRAPDWCDPYVTAEDFNAVVVRAQGAPGVYPRLADEAANAVERADLNLEELGAALLALYAMVAARDLGADG